MSNIYIYEAGTLTYLHKHNMFDKAINWRNTLDSWCKDVDIKTFNPSITFLKERNRAYDGLMAVRQNDLFLNLTNMMVVQMDYLDFSPGTQYELTTYKQLYPWKPIIAFGEEPRHWSPHISSCIQEYCKDINEVIELISNMFIQ